MKKGIQNRGKSKMKPRKQAVEVICPKCKFTEIIYMPKEELPRCPECQKAQMVIREILSEGKSY